MDRLRQLITQYSRWKGLEEYCIRIDGYLTSDFSIAVENTKALLESVCKTILQEKETEYGANDSIQQLMTKTVSVFDAEHSNQLKQITRGLVNISQNLAEVRNTVAKVSHGQHVDALGEEVVDAITAAFLVNSTESIACFLIEFYEQVFPRKKPEAALRLEDHQEFNDYLDEEAFEPVQVLRQGGELAYEYSASEVLFSVEPRVYLTELTAFRELAAEGSV
ncbi:MAG: abortive infection family protein [Candidatus Thiodiazotropha lotti]